MGRPRQTTLEGRSVPAYPLEIQAWSDDGDGYWSSGYHEAEAFVTAIEEQYEGCGRWSPDHEERVARVRHKWWRFIPTPYGGGDGRYINAVPHSRGAFPVTVIYE